MAGEGLLDAGAGLLKGAAQTTSQTAEQDIQRQQMAMKPAEQLSGEIGDMAKIQEQKQAEGQLLQLKKQMGYVEVSPEIALGLTDTFKDPSFMKWIGKSMDPRLYTSLIAGRFHEDMQRMKPKYIKVQNGNNVQTIKEYWDPDTRQTVREPMDKGGPKFNPSAGLNMTAKQSQNWISNYLKVKSRHEAVKNNPITYNPDDPAYQKDEKWLTDMAPQFDAMSRGQAQAGEGELPASSSNAEIDMGDGGNDGDANAFFKEFQDNMSDDRGGL